MPHMPLLAIRSRFLATLFILATGSLFLISCGGDSTTTPDEDTGDEPRVLTISLDVSNANPGSRVAINGIPDDVKWVYGRVTLVGEVASSGLSLPKNPSPSLYR